jgi:hypothetical protein
MKQRGSGINLCTGLAKLANLTLKQHYCNTTQELSNGSIEIPTLDRVLQSSESSP